MKNCNRIKAGLFLAVVFCLSILSSVNAGEVIVSWNLNSEADLLGYKIYWGTASRNYNKTKDVGRVTSDKIPDLVEGTKYFFTVTAYDTAYNESDFSVEVSFTIPVNDTTSPEIVSVNPISITQLNLTYSEEVEKASAENPANYQINNAINIISVALDPNQRVVHIKTTSHPAGSYVITVNNVKDLASNSIAPNSSKTYQVVPDDTVLPTITSVQILDATHVDISFSEGIKKSTAENIQNFKINNGITILQANLNQNAFTVHLTTSSHQSGTTYTLTANNICDLAPTSNYILPNSSKQYKYIEIDSTPPQIYSVNIRNENLIDVIFSEKIEQLSAENTGNYKINHGVTVLAAILDINQKTMHLSTTAHAATLTYTLTVNNVKDQAQPPNVIAPNSSVIYTYQPDDHTPPAIMGALARDENHVDVTFSERIDRQGAELKSNYTIDKGITISRALLDSNQTMVRLTTTAHQTGETYTITINNITDQAPSPNSIASNSKIQYHCTFQDTEPPRLVEVQLVYATYLKLFFNETIERESAETISNYAISNGVQIWSVILDSSLKIVHLTTSQHRPNMNYTLTLNRVRDRSVNRNAIESNTTFQYDCNVSSGSLVLGMSRKSYELAYLKVGDKYYIDRKHKITSMPEELNGYLWIKTANDDRDNKDTTFLAFELTEQAKIYIAYDSRALNYPNWLINDFYRAGKQIGVSEYAGQLDLWEQECEPGLITLGANLADGAQGVESMYLVLIENKSGRLPGFQEDMSDPLSLGPANMSLLYQNYPNPFNAETEIRFQIPQNAYIELSIFNFKGQTVRTLIRGHKAAGHYVLKWDGKTDNGMVVPTGIYFSRLTIKNLEETDVNNSNRMVYDQVRKMIMVK